MLKMLSIFTRSDFDIRSKTRTDADPEPKGEIRDRAKTTQTFKKRALFYAIMELEITRNKLVKKFVREPELACEFRSELKGLKTTHIVDHLSDHIKLRDELLNMNVDQRI